MLPMASDAARMAPYMTIPWVEGGRTFAGADCWGWVRLVVLGFLNIELPLYERGQIGLYRNTMTGLSRWHRVERGEWMDVVLFRHELHIGIALDDGEMAHSERNVGPCVEAFRSPAWGKRLEGIYRYEP